MNLVCDLLTTRAEAASQTSPRCFADVAAGRDASGVVRGALSLHRAPLMNLGTSSGHKPLHSSSSTSSSSSKLLLEGVGHAACVRRSSAKKVAPLSTTSSTTDLSLSLDHGTNAPEAKIPVSELSVELAKDGERRVSGEVALGAFVEAPLQPAKGLKPKCPRRPEGLPGAKLRGAAASCIPDPSADLAATISHEALKVIDNTLFSHRISGWQRPRGTPPTSPKLESPMDPRQLPVKCPARAVPFGDTRRTNSEFGMNVFSLCAVWPDSESASIQPPGDDAPLPPPGRSSTEGAAVIQTTRVRRVLQYVTEWFAQFKTRRGRHDASFWC